MLICAVVSQPETFNSQEITNTIPFVDMSSSSPIWFITGSSSGFGWHLTLLALKSGHRVIATSRNPSRTPDLASQVKALGGKWLSLDVSWERERIENVILEAVGFWGLIDILVNSAGYALLGAFESFR